MFAFYMNIPPTSTKKKLRGFLGCLSGFFMDFLIWKKTHTLRMYIHNRLSIVRDMERILWAKSIS